MKNKIPTIIGFVAFILAKGFWGDIKDPVVNTAVAALSGFIIGCLVAGIRMILDSPKLKGTQLKKDIIVFSIIAAATLPLTFEHSGIPLIILISVFAIKVAYFNKPQTQEVKPQETVSVKESIPV